ncbi:MAG: hypothetical protein QM752_06865 [Gammaproteobacteria bacterium]
MNSGIKPEDVLSEDENYTVVQDVRLRKGTIAAALKNASILSAPDSTLEEREGAKAALIELAPALVLIGLYDHLTWKNQNIQNLVEEAAAKLRSK